MSKGISIFYKVTSKNDKNYILGYSGVNLNKIYESHKLLAYDGIIEIPINSLKEKSIKDAIEDADVHVIKECKYEWHEERLESSNGSISFFAFIVVNKLFKSYKEHGTIENEGSVVY